jgi:DNA-binding transcriptional ArsR family regulator
MEISDAVRSLSALAQETRLSVYRALVQAGVAGVTAGRIAESLGVAPATLSFHLKELHHAGLVSFRQDGRFVVYSANYERMNGLLAYLTENCCRGDAASCSPAAADACCPPPRKRRSAIKTPSKRIRR